MVDSSDLLWPGKICRRLSRSPLWVYAGIIQDYFPLRFYLCVSRGLF